MQETRASGSKNGRSIEIYASNIENSDSEDEDYPLQASKMKDIRHPARPLFRSETNLDETLVSKEDSEEEDYHRRLARNCHGS